MIANGKWCQAHDAIWKEPAASAPEQGMPPKGKSKGAPAPPVASPLAAADALAPGEVVEPLHDVMRPCLLHMWRASLRVLLWVKRLQSRDLREVTTMVLAIDENVVCCCTHATGSLKWWVAS
eukprot:205252-Amphidinium_carterae.1